jgi:hypothetical protein
MERKKLLTRSRKSDSKIPSGPGPDCGRHQRRPEKIKASEYPASSEAASESCRT